MNITVFGASGRTGIPLVKQALEAGHKVTALVRTPSKLNIQHPNLTVVQGNIASQVDIEKAIPEGTDAVVSVLSPEPKSEPTLLPGAAESILKVMERRGIKRLLWMTGAGVRFADDEPKLIDNVVRFLLKTTGANVLDQSEQAVRRVQSSDRDWTVVRAPMLTEDEKTGQIKVGMVGKGTGIRLTRADAAAFILDQVGKSEHVRRAPMISN